MLAVVITVLVVVPLTLLNMVSICRPLERARQMAQAIAGGDLSQRIEVVGHDEVADLQRALVHMEQSLGAIVAGARRQQAASPRPAPRLPRATRPVGAHRADRQPRKQGRGLAGPTYFDGAADGLSSQMAEPARRIGLGEATRRRRGAAGRGQHVHEIGPSRKIGDIIGLIDSMPSRPTSWR